MTYRATLKRVSDNSKTGPIPVSTTDSSTCPPTCPQFDTCYAKFGHLKLHWDKLDSGERGVEWEEFCEQVQALPRRTFWRHNQAGDLPGNGRRIDAQALQLLVEANRGKRGFTYSHYPLTVENLIAMEKATWSGFVVNLSCDSLKVSDRVRNVSDLPRVVVLPSTVKAHALHSPAGEKVVVCPATYRDDMNCARCQICYDTSPNRAVIGFPAHGVKKKVIDIRMLT